jgi:hypothetical protein
VGVLDEPYLHYNFSHGLAAWLRRHVKYADDEATVVARIRRGEAATSDGASGGDPTSRRRALKSLANRLPLLVRPVARFCYILIWRRGILDGRLGVLYALMLSVYEGMIAVLTAEKLGEPANPVTASQHDSCARMD